MKTTKKSYIVPETACEQFLNYRELMQSTPGTMGGGANDPGDVNDGDFHAPKRRVFF